MSRDTLTRRRTPPWFVLLMAALIAGCAGSDQQETRFYLLSPLPPDTVPLDSGADEPVALDIAALRLPQYLNRPQIVTRAANNQLALAEYAQWGGNLAKDMTRVLARNLSRLLSTPEVTIFSRRPPRPADVRVEVEVFEFERTPDARVRLSAQWRLRSGVDGAPIATRVSDLQSPPVPASLDMDATVDAMSTLWGEFAREIALTIADERP